MLRADPTSARMLVPAHADPWQATVKWDSGRGQSAENEFYVMRAGSHIGDQLGDTDESEKLVGDIGGGHIRGEGVVGARAMDGLPPDFGEVCQAAFQVGVRRWPGGQ